MEIKFIGHSCFEIKGKDATLVIDPYKPEFVGYKLPKLAADMVLVTHEHEDHNCVEGVSSKDPENPYLLINSPGEYERQGVFILGIPTFHDNKEGAKRGENNIYLIDIDGFCVLHLGDLGHELAKNVLERISDVDILLVPVGGTYTVDATEAVDIISSLEPGIVVPMHYATKDLAFAKDLAPLSTFLNEMGIEEQVNEKNVLKLTSGSDIPDETEVVILTPQH